MQWSKRRVLPSFENRFGFGFQIEHLHTLQHATCIYNDKACTYTHILLGIYHI